MLGIAYGLSRELCVFIFCEVFTKNGLSGLSPDYFLGQAWPDLRSGMANMCYCHEFNDMLNM